MPCITQPSRHYVPSHRQHYPLPFCLRGWHCAVSNTQAKAHQPFKICFWIRNTSTVELRQVVQTNSKTCFPYSSCHPRSRPFLGRTTAKDTKISCCWRTGLIDLHIHNPAPPLVVNTSPGSGGCFLIAGGGACMCCFFK